MFSKKYIVTILDSKWKVIKISKLSSIPRKDELLYLDSGYYEVLNVIHMIGKKNEHFIIVNNFSNKNEIQLPDNQEIKK